jgi:hypothetical protein
MIYLSELLNNNNLVNIRTDVINIIGGEKEVIPLLDWITGYASPKSCIQVFSSRIMEPLTKNKIRYKSIELPDNLIRQLKKFGSSTSKLENIVTVLLLVGKMMGGKE